MKKLFSSVDLFTLGVTTAAIGAVFAATMAFLVKGTALWVCLGVGAAIFAFGVFAAVKKYKAHKADKPKADTKKNIERVTLTAMFIGLAALCKLFSLQIPLFGGEGMKVGLSGIFTAFPAFLFGPLFGGLSSAASDIIGCIIAPSGAYNPLFTLTAFAGGFIKGLIWLAFVRTENKKLRRVFVAFFALVTVIGITFYASLASDGIKGGVYASAEELPSKAFVKNGDASFITHLITDRVNNTDNYTVTALPDTEEVHIPSSLNDGGAKANLKIASDCDVRGAKTVYVAEGSSYASTFESKGVTVVFEEAKTATPEEIAASGFTFGCDNNFRKNLASYRNFATFWMTLVGVLGLVTAGVEYAVSRMRAKKGKEENYGLRIFVAIFSSELVVTTLNTIILKEMTMAATWAKYGFIVVWIPRVIEGLVVCLVQAYVITILFGALNSALEKYKKH